MFLVDAALGDGDFSLPPGALSELLSRSGIPSERAIPIVSAFSGLSPSENPLPEGTEIVTVRDSEYPDHFRHLKRAPYLLYVRGRLPKRVFSLAVVGSRKATAYGKSVTERFVRDLAGTGVSIVS